MKTRRNEEIVRLRQRGETCAAIAELYGITDSRVSQICSEWWERHGRIPEDSIEPAENIYGLRKRKLRTAVYIRIKEGSTVDGPAVKAIRRQSVNDVQRITWQAAAETYLEQGKSQTALEKMLSECRAGKYDLIYTKSVRHFTGSIAETDRIVEELKALTPPVGVYFSGCGRYTLDPKSEAEWREFMELIDDEPM